MLESSLSFSHVCPFSFQYCRYLPPKGKKYHLIFPNMSESQWVHVWLVPRCSRPLREGFRERWSPRCLHRPLGALPTTYLDCIYLCRLRGLWNVWKHEYYLPGPPLLEMWRAGKWGIKTLFWVSKILLVNIFQFWGGSKGDKEKIFSCHSPTHPQHTAFWSHPENIQHERLSVCVCIFCLLEAMLA